MIRRKGSIGYSRRKRKIKKDETKGKYGKKKDGKRPLLRLEGK